jgi:predicted GIY-YIG superfamily endonuclease
MDMDSVDNVDEAEFCYNCQRRHVDLEWIPRQQISRLSRKTYFCISLRHAEVALCSCCKVYLQAGATEGFWPAMVWSFLSDKNNESSMLITLSLEEKWKFIPLTWRGWWLETVEHAGLTMHYPPPEVVDVTIDRNELTAALSSLRWKRMAPAMDKYLAVPSVRCPWGCGCYLHKTNEVPYEDLLLVKSNFSFRSTSPCNHHHQRRKWVDSARPDFPSSMSILENDNFVCHPSIILKENGPYLLCCMKHDKNTIERIVHVPSNPTGSLFTEASNQYSPVILKSRTLRKVKLNQYSDTYRTVELQGGYDGVDSAYCCSIGNRHVSNHLSRNRDYLSLQGREDVRQHFEMLCESNKSATYLPRANVKEMLHQASQYYPDITNTLIENLAGSTYVSVEDAILMQESAYDGQPMTILIGECQEPDIFEPSWPSNMIRVHPFDVHGERFASVQPPIAQSDVQGFHLWSILCCLLCVDELWNVTSRSMQTDSDAAGYLMALAWHQRRQDINRTGTRKSQKYYDLNHNTTNDDDSDIILDVYHQLVVRLNASDHAEALFWPTVSGDQRIGSCRDYWDPDHVENRYDYMIVTFSNNQNASYRQEADESHSLSYGDNQDPISTNDWEVLLLVTKLNVPPSSRLKQWDGSIFARHGGPKHRGWWMQQQVGSVFRKCQIDETILIPNLRLLVFRKKICTHAAHIRDRYLKYLGGQSAVYCATHESPLILSYKSDLKCCCDGCDIETTGREWVIIEAEYCNRDVSYICPHFGCKTAICEQDFSVFCNGIGKNHYLLSSICCKKTLNKETLVTSEHRDHDLVNDDDSNDEYEEHDAVFHHKRFDFNPDDDDDVNNDDNDDNSAHQQGQIEDHDNLLSNDFGPEESHELIADLLEDEEETEDDDNLDNDAGPLHPMTMAHSEEALLVELEPELEQNKEVLSIPLHIFLNRQGHCLIRRNSKLRPVRRHRSFMQRFVARSKGKCIPLLYGEGTLFPDIFYYSTQEGAVLGALPTAFWTDKNTLSRNGIGSMRLHASIRVNDPSLLTSTDSRYHFLTMDTLVNLGLRGNDSRLLLHRGFAERQDKNEGIAIRTAEGNEELYDDNVDNRSNVHKLSRLCEEDPGHFFYTQSCNQATARALRVLRKWVMSSEAVEKIMTKYNLTREEADATLRNSAAPFIQSTWNIFIDIWMNYIINSPEQPLGPIDWAWIRKEFQDKTGNVSHLHVIMKTFFDMTTKEGRNQILDKIRGALADLIRHDEIQELIDLGIFESKECLMEILQYATKFLTHQCGPRCQVVKKNEDGKNTFICKRPDNWLLSSNPGIHSMEEVFVSHTESALKILKDLDFAADHPQKGGIYITHPQLHMVRHVPKCSKNDGKFSPTNGGLFARYPSSSNLQNVNGHCLSAYLTSYIAEVDKVAIVHMKPPTSTEPNTIHGQYESLNNTKIKSVKKYHDERLAAKRGKVPMGRPVTQMEALTVINAEPLVSSTREFIHLSTCPREFRAAAPAPYLKNSCRPQDLQAILAVTGQTARERKSFPSHRLFTDHQLMVIRDELRAPLQTDRITHFSMRPPELRFVDNCVEYIRWFERKDVCPLFNPDKALDYLKSALNKDEANSTWLDGFNYKITVRQAAIRPLYELAQKRMRNVSRANQNTTEMRLPTLGTIRLLGKLLWMIEGYQSTAQYVYTRRTQEEHASLTAMFVSKKSSRKLPIVWWTPIYPRRKTAFLIQILLCMGRFTTEYELMLQGSIRASLIEAGMIDVCQPMHSFHEILRFYILRHLRVQSGGAYQFDRNLTDAHNLLKDTIFPTNTPSPLLGTPAVLYSSIIKDTDKKVTNHINERRRDFVTAVYREIRNCGLIHLVPDMESVIDARKNPIDAEIISKFFPPPLNSQQSTASHKEQSLIMIEVKKAVTVYRSCWQTHCNFVFVGGPGVGKTAVATFCSLYCLCIGLNGIPTSLVADRSKELGGVHFHRLIGMKGNCDTASPGRMAELALQSIYRRPEMLEFLRRLDFVNLDELGVFSAEYLGILDIVFRYIRGNSNFMGGLFVFCTMDHLQLLPFKGTPILLSLHVVTDFTFHRLTESVRANNDPALREIINLTRTIQWNNSKKLRLTKLLQENVNFLDSFDDPTIPADAVYVFGRKEPCRAAEKIMIERMKLMHAGMFRTVKCHDEESTTGGNWHPANEGTSRRLDKKLKQQRELVFYPNAKFEFTQVLKNKFNQGQLALMINVPSDNILDDKLPVKVFAAPSGVKNFPPSEQQNEEWLLTNEWTVVDVPLKTSGNESIMRDIQARRTQYPLKPRVSSTIHACMGSTLSAIVSAVVSLTNMPYNFSLWEAAQIVVLLSRTKTANAMFFIGDREATIKHLIDVLSGQQYRFLRFITSLLDKLCGESMGHIEILPQPTRFRPMDSQLPRIPGVYLIVSTKKPDFEYIGETKNLALRIEQHNSLQGSHLTAQPDLLPFAMHAYVIGFSDKTERLQFEAAWKLNNQRRQNISLNNNGRIDVGIDMITEINPDRNRRGIPPLRMVQCGTIETTLSNDNHH